MILNNIEVKGIDNAEAYYFLNPIYLTITSTTKFITNIKLNFTNRSAINSRGNDLTTAEFRLQSNPQGQIYVDISDYIKSAVMYPNGMFSKARFDENLKDVPYSLSDFKFTIEVSTREDATSTLFTFEKLFIYGYLDTATTNKAAPQVLSSDGVNDLGFSTYYPFYYNSKLSDEITYAEYKINYSTRKLDMYTRSKSTIPVENFIYLNNNCDTLYFRFLNQYGAYSIITFESYTYSTSTQVDNTNRIKINDLHWSRLLNLNSNIKFDKEFTAFQEFNSRFKGFVEDFITSQYVQVWNNDSGTFMDVEMISNSLPDSYDAGFEVSYKFRLINSVNL